MSLTTLPLDILDDMLLSLPYYELQHLCSTNKQFAQLCGDYGFWNRRALRDYSRSLPSPQQLYVEIAKQRNDCFVGPITEECLDKAIKSLDIELIKYYLKSRPDFIVNITDDYSDATVTKLQSLLAQYAVQDSEFFSLIFDNPYLVHKLFVKFFVDVLKKTESLDLIKLILLKNPEFLHALDRSTLIKIFERFTNYQHQANLSTSDLDFLVLLLPVIFELSSQPEPAYNTASCHFIARIVDVLGFSQFFTLLREVVVIATGGHVEFYQFIVCATIYLINAFDPKYYPLIKSILNTVPRNVSRSITNMANRGAYDNYLKSV